MRQLTTRTPRSAVGTNPGQRLWPVLTLLSIAVLIPTACVLWFMSQAVANERFAVRQRLTDVYRGQLESLRTRLGDHWQARIAALSPNGSTLNPSAVFEKAVRQDGWTAAIVRDNSGMVQYPGPAKSAATQSAPPDPLVEEQWQAAQALEFEHREYATAAAAYGEIAGQTKDTDLAARALQGQARCLLQSGKLADALKINAGPLLEPAYRDVLDEQGRSVSANAAMLTLQLIPNPSRPEYIQARDYLVDLLNDYSRCSLPSSQRLFLMEQLRQTLGDEHLFPMVAAEQLAARYVAMREPAPPPRVISPTSVPGIWACTSPDERVIGLIRETDIRAQAVALLKTSGSPVDATVDFLPAQQVLQSKTEPFVTVPAGEILPDWQLSLTLVGSNPFTTAAERRISKYVWIGVLVILSTCGIALVVGRHLGRQMKLTRLKNDLIATVSHELKTPLASIRALVDTLIERDGQDPQQTREYLGLIARENARLSRLIDNFLTFSRMERNRHAFEFTRCSAARIAQAASESLQERMQACRCEFHVDIAPDLPPITADFDAMVTVVINLLDNALKYTGDEKKVGLRVYADAGEVISEVADNGIGLTRRAARRVFDRFYQVDQSLSRRAGGCGLGLSIVQFIVRAHGGNVEVKSEPGQGSTFIVRVPAEISRVPADAATEVSA